MPYLSGSSSTARQMSEDQARLQAEEEAKKRAKERAKQKAMDAAMGKGAAAQTSTAIATGGNVPLQTVGGVATDSTGTISKGMQDHLGQKNPKPFKGGGFLDPQSEEWLRDLLKPTDTAEQEAMARRQHEAALGRSRADLAARGGMGGLGLAGGQLALGADMERQSANALADQILGIQTGAQELDLKRGGIASEFLDRGQERKMDDEFYQDVLGMLGMNEEDPSADRSRSGKTGSGSEWTFREGGPSGGWGPEGSSADLATVLPLGGETGSMEEVGRDDQGVYYQDPNGHWYFIPHEETAEQWE